MKNKLAKKKKICKNGFSVYFAKEKEQLIPGAAFFLLDKMYYHAVYIGDIDHKFVFQHFLNPSAPAYDQLWSRINSMCPWLANEQEIAPDDTRGVPGDGILAGSLGKDYKVYKHKVKSPSGTLHYWVLCDKTHEKNIAFGEPFFVISELHKSLLEYFDRASLSISKITNNADRVSIICNYLLNGGYYNTSGLYDCRMKEIIPERSDLSKILTNTAHHIHTAVQKGPPSTTSVSSSSTTMSGPHNGPHNGEGYGGGKAIDSNVVPWRSNKSPHNELKELYVDIVEHLQLIYEKNRYITGHASGTVYVRCYLPGNPLVEINFKKKLGVPAVHECVDKKSLMEDRVKFIPPEGRFTLLKYSVSEKPSPMVQAAIEQRLGVGHDEFQVTLNINSSTTIKNIEDLVVTLNFAKSPHYKVKPLQITHGRMESSDSSGARWILDQEVATGSLPVLRGCFEKSQEHTESSSPSLHSSLRPPPPPRVHSLSITYTHPGSPTTTHLPVHSISVDTPAHQLFKGVKYHTVVNDYQIRV